MGNALAKVRLPDGTILYGEFVGTNQHLRSNLYETAKSVHGFWREKQPKRDESLPQRVVIAEAATAYGNGITWKVKVDVIQRYVVEGNSTHRLPFHGEKPADRYDNTIYPDDGLPDWWHSDWPEMKSKFVTSIKVQDPDTGNMIDVEIRKLANGGMVGLDVSWLDHATESPRNPYDIGTIWVPETEDDEDDG